MKDISRVLILLLFIIALFAGLVFSGHNQTRVPLWLGTEFPAQPLSIWVIGAFISGGLIGLLLGLGLWRTTVTRRKIQQLQKKLMLTENQLKAQKQHTNFSEVK